MKEEKHYTLQELAKVWNCSDETVRRMVRNEPDVLKIRKGKKQARTAYRVPASVAQRIHTRLLNGR